MNSPVESEILVRRRRYRFLLDAARGRDSARGQVDGALSRLFSADAGLLRGVSSEPGESVIDRSPRCLVVAFLANRFGPQMMEYGVDLAEGR